MTDGLDPKPMLSPQRKPLRFRPLKAWKHFQNLMQNKEDTDQVFHIIGALNGRSLEKDFIAFSKTKAGQDRIAQRRYLPPLLDDHQALKKLPQGTVGRAYVEFMEREGLSAQGLVDEYSRFEDSADIQASGFNDVMEWYGNRLRDTHDLCHILTGYGRDALGEACVLGFSYSQNRGLGVLFISHMAGREINKSAPEGAPVMKAVKQGRMIGKAAQKIVAQDISALLAEPLEAARARLGIVPATEYIAVHERLKSEGVDPMDVLAAA